MPGWLIKSEVRGDRTHTRFYGRNSSSDREHRFSLKSSLISLL